MQPHPKLHFKVCSLGILLVPRNRIWNEEFSCLVNTMMCYLALPFGAIQTFSHLLRLVPTDGSKRSTFTGCFMFFEKKTYHLTQSYVSLSRDTYIQWLLYVEEKSPDPLLQFRSTMKGHFCSALPVGLDKVLAVITPQFNFYCTLTPLKMLFRTVINKAFACKSQLPINTDLTRALNLLGSILKKCN